MALTPVAPARGTGSGGLAVGAHIPAAGGLAKTGLPYLDAIGASAVQVYVSNPRGWATTPGIPAQDELFRAGCAQRGVPVYIHACLLVNLGSPVRPTVTNSVASLGHALARGHEIGATGVVFHAGSSVADAAGATGAGNSAGGAANGAAAGGAARKALRQVGRVLCPLLDRAAANGWPRLLVEPSAGGGHSLAARVEDLAAYLDAVERHPMLGVCLDTCHAFAAGHDLAAPGGMTATLDLLVATVGADRLGLIHANDSRDECGSRRDRHANVGAGKIGAAAFAELLAHPAAAGVPLIVETPSIGSAGHAADIATLRRLAGVAA